MSNYNEQIIIQYIKESNTIADVLRKMSLDPRGRNYKIVHNVIKKFNINTSHFVGKSHCKNVKGISVPWNEVLIENSEIILGTNRKIRLIKDKLLKNECYDCGLNTWKDKPIVLQIDHINGINNDHRLENLRLLCPNCHSQTDTFAGRNIKKSKTAPTNKNYCVCGNLKGKNNELCKSCFNAYKANSLTKIIWPNNDELLKMIHESNMYQVSKKLGVSFNAIKKRLKARGLIGVSGGS